MRCAGTAPSTPPPVLPPHWLSMWTPCCLSTNCTLRAARGCLVGLLEVEAAMPAASGELAIPPGDQPPPSSGPAWLMWPCVADLSGGQRAGERRSALCILGHACMRTGCDAATCHSFAHPSKHLRSHRLRKGLAAQPRARRHRQDPRQWGTGAHPHQLSRATPCPPFASHPPIHWAPTHHGLCGVPASSDMSGPAARDVTLCGVPAKPSAEPK